jgi:glycine oxidase
MNSPLRVAVAGAGVFGLASALSLARAGAVVTVHDPGLDHSNASAVAAGMLAPLSEALTDPTAAPHLDLLMAAQDLWPDFAVAHGLELDRSGAVLVGDEARLSALSAAAAELGFALSTADGATPPALAGQGARGWGGLRVPGDWRADAADLRRLMQAAQGLGVTLVSEPLRPGAYDLLVVATGASRDFLDAAPELAALTPIRGHILRYGALDYQGPVLRGPGAYAAPSRHGLLVGATMEVGEGREGVDLEVAAGLAVQAEAAFPGLIGQAWTAAAGVRAATPDGLPLVGASASPGVILACGARRNGWLLAPLVGAMVAALALGEAPGPWAARLNPRRFAT